MTRRRGHVTAARAASAPVLRRSAGFTLLELLLATAIMAAIGAVLYSALSVGFKARTSAARQVEAVRQASIVMQLLQQDFDSVLPQGVLAGPFVGSANGSSEAETDTVEFYTLGHDVLSDADDPLAAGARRVTLLLRTDINPPELVRQVEANLLAPVEHEPAEEVLATNVRALALRYFDGDAWTTSWDSTAEGNVLPRAVEVTITFDVPSPADATRPYRVRQVIPLACAADAEEGADAN